jgi:hypothetical protein
MRWGIRLKNKDLFGMKDEIVRILGAPDHGVTRRDFVSGLNVVPSFDAQLF